jgi:hypothetical protein
LESALVLERKLATTLIASRFLREAGGKDMIIEEETLLRPRDRRSRAVTARTPCGRGAIAMLLECGHVTRRRPALCQPSRLICEQC